jgi:hypothetical protein
MEKTYLLTSNVAADVTLSVGVSRVFYATRQPLAPVACFWCGRSSMTIDFTTAGG